MVSWSSWLQPIDRSTRPWKNYRNSAPKPHQKEREAIPYKSKSSHSNWLKVNIPTHISIPNTYFLVSKSAFMAHDRETRLGVLPTRNLETCAKNLCSHKFCHICTGDVDGSERGWRGVWWRRGCRTLKGPTRNRPMFSPNLVRKTVLCVWPFPVGKLYRYPNLSFDDVIPRLLWQHHADLVPGRLLLHSNFRGSLFKMGWNRFSAATKVI